MPSFEDFINHNNKILHKQCAAYIIGRPVVNFVNEVHHPLLVGKDLFQGDFSKKSTGGHNATFRFKSSEEKEEGQTSLVNAVYVLRQNEHDKRDNNWITVGRSSKSDITINDYAISKEHAFFTRKGNLYYVADLGSTNGVVVNHRKLKSQELYPLRLGQSVNFGRFSFLFVHPLYYYCMVYTKAISTFPEQKDLLRVAEETESNVLFQIAKQNGYKPLDEGSFQRKHLIKHMKNNLQIVELIRWLCQLPLT